MINIEIQCADVLSSMRTLKPVIHSITNFVVMNSTANTLLAIGAAPIMAHAKEELDEITSIAHAIVLNIGTLSVRWIESMHLAAQFAKNKNKSLVLDPVGAGATKLRTTTAMELIKKYSPTILRGNASEILALASEVSQTRGVDAIHSSDLAISAAKAIASQYNMVVAVTGSVDYVTDGNITYAIQNGDEYLSKVTGTGCAATVVIGAFSAASQDPVLAAVAALSFFGLAGEMAAKKCAGPGSFWVAMLDSLYQLTPEQLKNGARIEKL